MRKKARLLASFLGLVLGLHVLLPSAQAAQEAENASKDKMARKVVLVLLDGLRLSDLSPERTPNLWRMQKLGSVGVMNLNTLGAKNEVNAALTLGAGSRAGAVVSAAEAMEVDETIHRDGHVLTGRELYVRHMGTEPTGRIVVSQWPLLLEGVDKSKSNTAVLGALGDAVHEAGGKTAVLGNADWGDELNRPAALIAADSKGQVDDGSLRAGNVSDLTRPYGMRTDVESLYTQYRNVRNQANLFVLEPGDLGRWYRTQVLMEDSQLQSLYNLALHEGDELIGKLLPDIGPNTMLAVVSPIKHPAADAPALAPVLLAGGDVMVGGLLTSSTTKRKGLIANYDLAPTFASFLQGLGYVHTHQAWLGQPALGQTVMNAKQDSLHLLRQQVDRMLVPSNARAVLVKPWINTWIGLAALLLLAEWFRRPWLRYLTPLAELMLVFPLSWLCVPLFAPTSTEQTVWYSLGLTVSIGLMLRGLRDPFVRLGVLAGGTVLTLVADLLLGAPLLKQSVLSYDPIAGARYYGIGNEYMGILLGALLLGLNAAARSRQKIGVRGRALLAALFLLVIYLFAAPRIGTNAGGALAAAIGCTYALMQFSDWRMTRRNWLWLSSVAVVVVLGMMVMNVMLPSSEQTHIGRSARELVDGQFSELYQLVARKLQLNLLLLRVSAWGKLFLLLLAFLVVRVYSRRDAEAALLRNGRMIVTAAVAAFLFNDSGVVAAGLALLYAAVPLVDPVPQQAMEIQNWDILVQDTAPPE
ncbi:hypothetical protein [Tumebacillus permanentifrigoris]|uniref:Type I phosphodiesterase/nucleotide pyrophosphatase n=1 Tax=Tumebacillus permanentifrigoris TaxID=378543 RepID=A0A316DTS3_9BACL|nr:hypothetical protein [Tumebacillus permanentifrigoris]PWK11291.1 hypothetical protein C7459_11186 [Tumebacillus permanentifrigoris]